MTSPRGALRAASNRWRQHLQNCAACTAARRGRTGKSGCDPGARLLEELGAAQTRLMQRTAKMDESQGSLWE
jgi:hypothetical protein